MTEKTVLFLSRYFPPMFDVGGKRVYRFANYLQAHGWRSVVWTGAVPTQRAIDPTPLRLPEGTEVIREYYPSWKQEMKARMSDGTVKKPVTRSVEGEAVPWAKRVWRQLKWPVDNDLWLAPRAALALREVVEREGVDVIYASSSPYSSLVFGALASALTGKPLVADLRDPWTLNFLHARRPRWTQSIDAAVEAYVLRAARKVVFTCESASEAYRQHYPDLPPGHIQTITNSFDPSQRPPAAVAPKTGPITLTHFGNCYGPRSLRTILRALHRFHLRHPELPRDTFCLRNLGRLASDDLALAQELGLEDVLTGRPFVPYEEGLALLVNSDLQILLAYGDETIFLPAKLFDYLLTGAPILCLAQPSELTQIIEATQSGRHARPDDIEGVCDILTATFEARQRGEALCEPLEEEALRYSSPQTAARLADLLDEVIR